MSDNGFDPSAHQDPVRALTQRIRGMPIGHAVRLANGTVVKSVPVRHGATHTRRFAVAPKGSRPKAGGGSTFGTAIEAAKAALK